MLEAKEHDHEHNRGHAKQKTEFDLREKPLGGESNSEKADQKDEQLKEIRQVQHAQLLTKRAFPSQNRF